MQIAAIAWILALAILATCNAHGADMGQRTMLEYPAGLKGLAWLLKYPLIIAGVAGSMIGAAVVSSYQRKNRLQQFLVNASIAICLTPAVFEVTDIEPSIPTWLAAALLLGIVSGTVLQWWVDPKIQSSLKHAVSHQIDNRLGGGEAPDRAKE